MHTDRIQCQATDASGTARDFSVPANTLAVATHPGAPWRIIPDEVRHAADTLSSVATRWSDTLLPPPSLGIKTGCNDAFLLADADVPHELRKWTRPVLRGDHVSAWHSADSDTAIVIPFDTTGRPLSRLTPPLTRHFADHRRALTARTDLRPRDPWWSLFRTDLLATTGWRVVWADIGRTLRATLLPPESQAVPLNTCYGVRLHDPIDALALTALLNAPTTTAWLSLVAEPARGGYHRFMGWTVLALPLPPWDRARELLAPLTARARRGEPVTVETLHHSTLAAYNISHQQIAPLLAWTSEGIAAERTSRARAS